MKGINTVQDVLRHSADQLEKVGSDRDWYKEQYLQLKKEADVQEVMHLIVLFAAYGYYDVSCF